MKKLFATFIATIILMTGCTVTGGQSSSKTFPLTGGVDLTNLYSEQNNYLTGTKTKEYTTVYTPNINYVYVYLFYYNWQTESNLTYEEIEDYLSQEYEDDGTLRMYNNGNWPSIQKYVEWCNQEDNTENLEFFLDKVFAKIGVIYKEEAITKDDFFNDLSKHNLTEVMKSIQNENYVASFTDGNKYDVGEAVRDDGETTTSINIEN